MRIKLYQKGNKIEPYTIKDSEQKKVNVWQEAMSQPKKKITQGLPPDQLPNMFGNPKESPWRYLVRLYNSPRIKKIVDTERGDYYLSEKKYYANNLKALEDWESLKKDMPDLFDDEYKQMLEKQKLQARAEQNQLV